MYTEFMKMVAWLIKEHFGAFLALCAVLAVWLGALAFIIEYFTAEIKARLYAKKERDKYRCG